VEYESLTHFPNDFDSFSLHVLVAIDVVTAPMISSHPQGPSCRRHHRTDGCLSFADGLHASPRFTSLWMSGESVMQ